MIRCGGLEGDFAKAAVRKDRLGIAVVEDVRDLVGLKMPVDRREVETDAMAGPIDIEEVVVVGQNDRDTISVL